MTPQPKSPQAARLGISLRRAREQAGHTLKALVAVPGGATSPWSVGHLSKVERGIENATKELVEYYIKRTSADAKPLRRLLARVPRGAPVGHKATTVRRPRTRAGPGVRPSIAGIWLSEYEYETSSRRGEQQTSGHYLVLRKRDSEWIGISRPQRHGSKLEVRGIIDRDRLFTAFWQEWTSGKKLYHGAFQLIIDPVATSMRGLWVGFNRRSTIGTGIWRMTLITRRTDPKTMRQYDYADPDKWAGPVDPPPA